MTWIIWLGIVLGAIAAIAIGLTAYGAARWADATRTLLRRLEGARMPLTTSRYDVHELEGLPAPVQRYFRAVLKDGQSSIAAATVEHIGTFNLNPAILGLFSLARPVNAHDLAQGELVRFFAETAWYPTALLPSQGVHWNAVDENSAKATLVDGEVSVTMLVSFNEAGLIESVRVEARGALVGNAVVPTPWEGRWSNYQERNGMLVPLAAEASWLHRAGRQPYWRGTITALTHEFSNA